MHGAHDERMRAEEDAEHAEFIRQQKLAEKEEEVPDDEPSPENPETSVPVYHSPLVPPPQQPPGFFENFAALRYTPICGDCFDPKRQKIVEGAHCGLTAPSKCGDCGERSPSCQVTQTCFPVCDFCVHHDTDCPNGYYWSTDIPRVPALDDVNPEPSKVNYLSGACHCCPTVNSIESKKLQLRCMHKGVYEEEEDEEEEEESDEEEEESETGSSVEEPEPVEKFKTITLQGVRYKYSLATGAVYIIHKDADEKDDSGSWRTLLQDSLGTLVDKKIRWTKKGGVQPAQSRQELHERDHEREDVHEQGEAS